MTLLRKILKPFGFPEYKTQKNYTLPWGMSEADWVAIQRLMLSEDFEVLRKTLDNVVNSYAEAMLATEQTEMLHFLRGKIQGVRYTLEIVDEIHKKEKDFLEHERRRAETGIAGPASARNATFGTPAWRDRNASKPGV